MPTRPWLGSAPQGDPRSPSTTAAVASSAATPTTTVQVTRSALRVERPDHSAAATTAAAGSSASTRAPSPARARSPCTTSALAVAATIVASATGPTRRPFGASATQPVAASAHSPMPVRLAVSATVVASSHAASAPGTASARRRAVAAPRATGRALAQTRASAGGYSNGPDGRQLPQRSSASGSEVAIVAARPLIALPTPATSRTPACAPGAGTDAAATTTAHKARIAAAPAEPMALSCTSR